MELVRTFVAVGPAIDWRAPPGGRIWAPRTGRPLVAAM